MIDADAIITQVNRSNQLTIELMHLLTKSNMLLTEYVLVKEVEQGTRGSARPDMQRLLAAGAAVPQIEPPTTDGAKRRSPNRAYVVKPDTKVADVVTWAREHDGTLDIGEFRADYLAKKKTPASFVQTAIHAACRSLVDHGIFERLGPTAYRLKPNAPGLHLLPASSSAPPAETPEPVAAPAANTGGRTFPHTLTHQDKIIAFAEKHGGIFRVQAARSAWKNRRDMPPTYTKTTIFTDLGTLASRGLLEKVGPGEYRVLSA